VPIALAFVAILIAGIAILIQPRISAQEKDDFPQLFKVSTFATDNFFPFLGVSVVVLLVTWITTSFNMRVANRRLGRSLLEATYVQKRGAIAVFIAGAVAVIGLTAYLFWPAVGSVIETALEFIQLFRSGAGPA
jgi:hypothetical protein